MKRREAKALTYAKPASAEREAAQKKGAEAKHQETLRAQREKAERTGGASGPPKGGGGGGGGGAKPHPSAKMEAAKQKRLEKERKAHLKATAAETERLRQKHAGQKGPEPEPK